MRKEWIEAQFRIENFGMKSIEKQLSAFRQKDVNFLEINRETYRRFLKQTKTASYELIENISPNSNRVHNKKCRLIVLRFLLEFLNSGAMVLFYDETTVSHYSFQKKGWYCASFKQRFIRRTSFKPVKMLACTSITDLQTIQFFRKVSAETVSEFLEATIQRCRQKDPKQLIVVFLDNSTLHRTETIKGLAYRLKIVLLYNAPDTPYTNIIERLFEYVKRDLRVSSFVSDYRSIEMIIKRARNFKKYHLRRAVRLELGNFDRIILEDDL